ncbi:MAG: amidohydrolase family protein [Cryomorphaceae bacterium]|nr:amidohydrolase family protein [Cryomorphaceae bacterium]
MKKSMLLIALLSWCNWALSQSLHSREGIQDDRSKLTYAIINANITTAPGKKITNGIIIVQDGKVVNIGQSITIPKNAVTIDADGKYVYPSFIELNSNFGLRSPDKKDKSGGGPEYERTDGKSAFGWNKAIRADQSASSLFEHDEDAAKKMRENGIGIVLSHYQDGIARGTGSLVALTDAGENISMIQAVASTHFSFDKGSSSQQYPSSQMGAMALLRQTFIDLEWYRGQKEINEKHLHLEALKCCEKLPNFFSATDKMTGLRAFRLGAEFKRDFILLGSGDEYQILPDIQGKSIRYVLPLNFPDVPAVQHPMMAREMSIRDLKHWELAPYNARILHDHKIEFAFTFEGVKNVFSTLHLLGKSGLSEETILGALTTNPARWIHFESLGAIAKGNPANFFISRDSLLAEKNQVYEHWVMGRRYQIKEISEYQMEGVYVLDGDTLEIKKSKFTLTTKAGQNISGTFSKKNNQLTIPYSIDDEFFVLNLEFTGHGQISNPSRYFSESSKVKIIADVKVVSTGGTKDSTVQSVVDEYFDYKAALWYPFQAYGNPLMVEKEKPETYLIKNVTLWSMVHEIPQPGMDVIIRKGKISKIGVNLKVPKGAVVIDGSEMHLSPGLIDEHSHIAISRGVNESGSSISSEVRIGDVVNHEDINIYRQLSGGTTASQLLHGSANVIGGQSALVKLRWGQSAEAMKIENAPKFIKFALGENVKQSNWGDRMNVRYPQTRMGVEQFLFESFYRAQSYGTSGERARRIDLELEALWEILNGERHISCHSYVQSEINMLMKVADSMGFKINTFTHVLEGYKVADKLKVHGAAGSTFSDWWAYKMEVNEAIPFNAAAMAKAGVLTAINSDDAEMGRRLNHEAAKVLRYGGDDPVEALKMVTLNPAKMLHLDHRIGSVEEGKDADLVLWSDVPLSINARAIKTFVDGELLFDREAQEEEQMRLRKERVRLIKKALQAANSGKPIATPESEIDSEYHCDTLEEIHFHEK